MDTTNTKANKLWNDTWKPEIHSTEYAVKRIKSAQSAKLTPVKIDHDDMYGYFQGSHGRYETFLDFCPCGDFIRSKLPCKHIYRLAIELGILNIDANNSANAIPTPKNERINFAETADIIESLPLNAQHKLLEVSRGLNSSNPICQIDFSDSIIKLLESGIVVESEPHNHVINYGKKAELIAFLKEENIPYGKNSKKSELEELCQQHALQKAKKKFGYAIHVSIPTKFSAQKIHSYLHRKFDSDYYYDIYKGFIEVQLLNTVLPDDVITLQLIKHGHYSPDGKTILIK